MNYIKSAINRESREASHENNSYNINYDNNQINNKDETLKVITNQILNERIEKIFTYFSNYLNSNNLIAKEFFKKYSFKPIFDENDVEYSDEAIFIKTFTDEMNKIGLVLDSIDMQCVFLKLKIHDDYDALSINVIESLVFGQFGNSKEFNNVNEVNSNNDINIYYNQINNNFSNASSANEKRIKNNTEIEGEISINNNIQDFNNNHDNNKEKNVDNKYEILNINNPNVNITENIKVDENSINKKIETGKQLERGRSERSDNKNITKEENLALDIYIMSKISDVMDNDLLKNLEVKMTDTSVIMKTMNMSVKDKNEKSIVINDGK